MITFRGSARPDEKWSLPLFTISVSALPEFLFRGQNCVRVCARARVYAGTSVHLKDAPRCFLSASFSLLPLCLIDRKCPWTKPARRALPGQATRVPGGFWEERERRRRRLENEEGACAALSVLRVVSTVPKPYHQEVRLERLRRGDGRKGTATFEANPSSTKNLQAWMGAPVPRCRFPSGFSGREVNKIDPYLPCVQLCARECSGKVEGHVVAP